MASPSPSFGAGSHPGEGWKTLCWLNLLVGQGREGEARPGYMQGERGGRSWKALVKHGAQLWNLSVVISLKALCSACRLDTWVQTQGPFSSPPAPVPQSGLLLKSILLPP